MQHQITIAVDATEAHQFAAWLNEQGHDARVGDSTGNYVDGTPTDADADAQAVLNTLWDQYCDAGGIEPVWIAWPSADRVPEVGASIEITEQPIRNDDGEVIGMGEVAPVPGIVERIGAHWSNQPEGRSGYWIRVKPRAES